MFINYRNVRQTILIFGCISVGILLLFQLSKFSLFYSEDLSEVFIVLSGVLFITIGYIINKYMNQKGFIKRDYSKNVKKSNLSKQEYKVLTLMSEGMSNSEIANHLFISENTVKTHVSKILSKLKAKRRTEAVRIGRDLDILQ